MSRPAPPLVVLALALAIPAVPVVHRAAGADPRPVRGLPDLDPAAPAGLALQRPPGGADGAARVGDHDPQPRPGRAAPAHRPDLRLRATPCRPDQRRRPHGACPDAGPLRYVTGYGHRHWHLLGLARYTLRNLRTGRVPTDRKRGFCLRDAAFASRQCAHNRPHAARLALGLAPGRADTYEPQLEGQHIAITPRTAPSGTYLLTQTVDPQRRMRQTTRVKDSASLLLRLTWHRGRPLPAVRVLRPCPRHPQLPVTQRSTSEPTEGDHAP